MVSNSKLSVSNIVPDSLQLISTVCGRVLSDVRRPTLRDVNGDHVAIGNTIGPALMIVNALHQ